MRVKFLLFILFVLPARSANSQNGYEHGRDTGWENIDVHVLDTPKHLEKSVDALADYFLEVAKTDAEKARAIYRWLTDRISFDVEILITGEQQLITGQDVLKTRTAVCTGYVILFEELAIAMNLDVHIITGLSKGYGFDVRGASEEVKNHSWIAAQIDEDWMLIDPTWGSGYIDEESDQFVKEFNSFYFFADPKFLTYTHLPLDNRWQLRSRSVSKAEFMDYAVISSHFFGYGLRFDDNLSLINKAEGSFSTRFQVPENIVLRPEITYGSEELQRHHFIRYDGSNASISLVMDRVGEYKIELYAAETDEANSPFYLAGYFYINNQSESLEALYPHFLGYFDVSRSNLISPLFYELQGSKAHLFEIEVPGAQEVYLANLEHDWWYSLDRAVEESTGSDRFIGSALPPQGEVRLVARFPGDEFYAMLVAFAIQR